LLFFSTRSPHGHTDTTPLTSIPFLNNNNNRHTIFNMRRRSMSWISWPLASILRSAPEPYYGQPPANKLPITFRSWNTHLTLRSPAHQSKAARSGSRSPKRQPMPRNGSRPDMVEEGQQTDKSPEITRSMLDASDES
jgi:hypothetical protein